jgi:predicted nucleotidyltransferase component of viral defense system
MISKNEILKFAKHYKLPANIIEKDYVLIWLLDGISNHKSFYNKWIFKGGTCLKKCYFEEYRCKAVMSKWY